MYEEFYGFAQSPFTLAPDPRFLYLSGTHDDALRQLLQAIRRKEGFIVLAGDIGTGKTTLCRALIEQFDATTFTSLVLNPFVTIEELLQEVLLDFGVISQDTLQGGRAASITRHELISTLHEFLLSLQPIGGVAVLIIDEAQHLTPEVLEQIRVISNLETNNAKLLQIILVGQLDLLTMLGQQGMRQLDQRISLRARLEPLTRIEMEAYIGHRLGVARGSSSVTFEAKALDIVHAHSQGVPRVINLLCDRSLMLAAESGSGSIGADIVKKAAAALELKPAGGTSSRSSSRTSSSGASPRRLPTWAIITAGLLALGALAISAAFVLTPAERMVEAPVLAKPASPAVPVNLAPTVPRKSPPAATPPLWPQPPPEAQEP
jgi:general secretion pathway protein A